MQVCTLRKPERDIWAVADIQVPLDAPQDVKDLVMACRQKDPKERPTIEEVCEILDRICEDTAGF